MQRLFIPILVCVIHLFSGIGRAADSWTLLTSDFREQTVEVRSLDQNGVQVFSGETKNLISMDQFLQMERANAAQETRDQSGLILQLSGGDRIAGQPVAIENERIKWKNPIIGEINFSLREVSAIVREDLPHAPIDPKRLEDVILLANGDRVAGVVSAIEPAVVSIQTGGDVVPVPMESISAIFFALTGASSNPADRAFRIQLTDGSTFVVSGIRLSPESVELSFINAASVRIPSSSVRGIEQINGPVEWLSTIQPSENVQMPYFNFEWPAQMDRTVMGKPIRIADRTYSRGIGVHSYSRLVYPLDGRRNSFRTQYAIDGDLPYADVTVRILLDGQIVHVTTNVRSGWMSPVVQIDLRDAKSLTLEVDYGDNHDTQDRLVWIQPALLREMPATQP